MKRFLYVLGGGVLLALGIAKAAGLLYLLAIGRTVTLKFGVKQGVYAICYIVGGVALLLAARTGRERRREDAV